MDNRSILTLANVFTGYSFSQSLATIFSYYRILGVAIEVIPKYNNQDPVQDGSSVFLGFRMGDTGSMAISEIKALNQNLLLDPRNRQRRYWRVFNQQGYWSISNTMILGEFVVASENDGDKNGLTAYDGKT